MTTRGGIHHMAVVVPDADEAARFHERALGWTRLTDERLTGAAAAQMGAVSGMSDATAFNTIMLRNPDGGAGAQLEVIDVETPRGTGHELHPGLSVESYRVDDAQAAWDELIAAGATPVQELTEASLAGWDLRLGTVRTFAQGLLEIIEYLPR